MKNFKKEPSDFEKALAERASLFEKKNIFKQISHQEKEDPFAKIKQAYRELDAELTVKNVQIKVNMAKREMAPYVRSLEILKSEVEHDIPYSTVTLTNLKNFLDHQSNWNRDILTKSKTIFLFRKEAYEFIDKVGYFKFDYKYNDEYKAIKCHDGDFDYNIHGKVISILNENTLKFESDSTLDFESDNAVDLESDIECLGDLQWQ